MEIGATGTYVLLADVVASVREYAQSLDDPHSGGVIHELATWLGGGQDAREVVEVASEEAASDAEVYRVELYPDPPDDPKPKWYARSVDSEGNILYTSSGSFDYDYVHKEASELWPDKQIYQLQRWADDSVFVENQERKAYPTAAPMRERVSPKRMFA